MVPSFPLLSCESSVSVKENPDRKKNVLIANGFNSVRLMSIRVIESQTGFYQISFFTQFTKIYSFEICFIRVMVFRKIGIVNVQLVKDNFATRKHYHPKLLTSKKQLAIRKKIYTFDS